MVILIVLVIFLYCYVACSTMSDETKTSFFVFQSAIIVLIIVINVLSSI